jgi:hypothetical protein
MLKKLFIFLVTLVIVKAQSLSALLTQRGGNYNTIFLNPAKLSYQNNSTKIKADFINTSINLSKDSYNFLKELKSATSASNKNREISQLLKKNIGNILSFSAHNLSSLSQTQNNLSWSLGIVNTIDGYFITHSGFGSKGAMESFIEKYKALIATISLKKDYIDYGINIKAIEKTQSIHNYSINEMIKNSSFSDYFNSRNTQKESALGLDMGIVYTVPDYMFNPKFSFSVLNIGDSSFQDIGSLPSTSNIGFLLTPYKNTSIQLDYIDLFKHQKEQNFDGAFKLDLSKDFFNKHFKLNTGIVYNAISFGVEYHYSLFSLTIHSYKTTKNYNQEKERQYALSMALSW